MAAVDDQPACPGQLSDHRTRADAVAGLAAAQKHLDGSADGVGDGVQLGVQAAFRAPDEPPAPAFFGAKLDAVRWVFRCVERRFRKSARV
jgi:hypothetical protein